MTEQPVIRLRFDSRQSLEAEVAANLQHGRAFVAQRVGLAPRTIVQLVLQTPGGEHALCAEVVMVASDGAMQGVGLALHDLDRVALHDFAREAFASAEAPFVPEPEELSDPERSAPRGAHAAGVERQKELRSLNLAQQIKLARTGELADRVSLERITGKPVWEALLHNPRLTIAEVARIARKGTVPRHLLELIADNASWTKVGVVRRALLSNPKLGSELLPRVLKFAPRHEIKAMVKNPAYPAQVRAAAKRFEAGEG